MFNLEERTKRIIKEQGKESDNHHSKILRLIVEKKDLYLSMIYAELLKTSCELMQQEKFKEFFTQKETTYKKEIQPKEKLTREKQELRDRIIYCTLRNLEKNDKGVRSKEIASHLSKIYPNTKNLNYIIARTLRDHGKEYGIGRENIYPSACLKIYKIADHELAKEKLKELESYRNSLALKSQLTFDKNETYIHKET